MGMLPPADGREQLIKKDGRTADIIRAILAVVPEVTEQTRKFSGQFSADYEGLRELWHWVHNNIHYQEDPLGVQWIREPRRLWADREGDCKSYTLFIVSVLKNLGIPYLIRFVNTETPGSKEVNHVYPVAILPNGRAVPMDAIDKARFDWEPRRFFKKDYSMAEISRLSGIGAAAASEADLEQYAADIRRINAEIPDEVLENDITQMTQGEFARFMATQRYQALADNAATPGEASRFGGVVLALKEGSIAGIAGTADAARIQQFLQQTDQQTGRAFVPPVIEIPAGVAGVGSLISKLKDLASDVANVWKKLINHLFKVAIPLAAPFFLFAFAKKKLKGRSLAKQKRQLEVLNWVKNTGKFENDGQVFDAIRTGIANKFGKSPEQIIEEAAKPKGKVGAVVAATLALLGAIKPLIEMIGKIASVFKKKAPAVSDGDAPDLEILAQEGFEGESISMPNATSDSSPAGSSAGGGAGGTNQMLLLGGLALVGYMLINK